MALYLLESSLCWLLFYGFYALTLSRETFFRLNRWYLLATLALGAAIPHLEVPLEWVVQTPEVLDVWFPVVEFDPNLVVTAPAETFDIWDYLLPLYWLGTGLALLRFLAGLGQIFRLYIKGEKIAHGKYTLVLTEPGRLPFSFGRWLFVSRDNHFTNEETEKVIGHELAHIRGWHTADVMVLELACVFLWWSPALYLYRRSLRTVHEYLADHAVLKTARRKEYGHFLIRQTYLPAKQLQSGMQPAIANHFFHSQLKKRIIMMTKTKSGKPALLKYLMVFPLLVLAMLLFANREALAQVQVIGKPLETPVEKEQLIEIRIPDGNSTEPRTAMGYPQELPAVLYILDGEEVSQEKINELNPATIESIDVLKDENAVKAYGERGRKGVIVIKTKKAVAQEPVDDLPRFPGCEQINDETQRNDCSVSKLINFITSNLRYPKEARDAKTEGTVMASFMVETDGRLTDISIVRTLGNGTDEEVKRVIGLMPNWIPAQKNGQTVRSEMKLPVSFKLDAGAANNGEVFTAVEEMPRFPGCEDSSSDANAKQQCSNRKMMEFILQNMKYPKEAREKGVQGVVVVQFVVDKNGSIRDAKIVKGIGSGCDEEVLRIVGDMPSGWTPGKQSGKSVSVSMTLPVKFQADTPAPAKKVLELKGFNASPNPAGRQVRLSFEGATNPVKIQVVDSVQKVVFEQQINDFSGRYKETINLSKAAKGMAFILVSQEGFEPFAYKLAIQ